MGLEILQRRNERMLTVGNCSHYISGDAPPVRLFEVIAAAAISASVGLSPLAANPVARRRHFNDIMRMPIIRCKSAGVKLAASVAPTGERRLLTFMWCTYSTGIRLAQALFANALRTAGVRPENVLLMWLGQPNRFPELFANTFIPEASNFSVMAPRNGYSAAAKSRVRRSIRHELEFE
ncbi:hypothetical protein [Streptomyces sp. NBC_00076]|uniref:hypothetical protein n=1 Tax=Streptomyces sp. NBC_00076 TaxID=2975642 RepID=UPI0032533E5E